MTAAMVQLAEGGDRNAVHGGKLLRNVAADRRIARRKLVHMADRNAGGLFDEHEFRAKH